MNIILLIVSILLAQDPSARGVAAGLQPGMRLVYGSGDAGVLAARDPASMIRGAA